MITSEEIAVVSKLLPIDRYKYFIKKIADYKEVWCLKDEEGNYALSEIEDEVLFSLWSDVKFVENCLEDDWKDYTPVKLSLDELETIVFPIIKEKGYLIDVFPVPGKTGFIVDLDEFVRDLAEELENYE